MPVGIGAPGPSGIPGFNIAKNLTAFSGGGNTSATALPAFVNVVGTVNTTSDSVQLFPAADAQQCMVVNNGLNTCTVYGNYNASQGTQDTIANATQTTQVTTGLPVPAGKAQVFVCIQGQAGNTSAPTSGQWKALF